jgi:hypothetical protein
MDIYCTVSTKEAVYFFVANDSIGLARITKQIRKGCKGYDASTTMTVNQARQFYKQLQAR